MKTKIVRNPMATPSLCLHVSGVDCEEVVDSYTEKELRGLIVDLEDQLEILGRQIRSEELNTPNMFTL